MAGALCKLLGKGPRATMGAQTCRRRERTGKVEQRNAHSGFWRHLIKGEEAPTTAPNNRGLPPTPPNTAMHPQRTDAKGLGALDEETLVGRSLAAGRNGGGRGLGGLLLGGLGHDGVWKGREKDVPASHRDPEAALRTRHGAAASRKPRSDSRGDEEGCVCGPVHGEPPATSDTRPHARSPLACAMPRRAARMPV